MVALSTYTEKAGLAVLLTLGIALVTMGVDLCEAGEYETGIVLVALGIALVLIYLVFDEKAVEKVAERVLRRKLNFD